MSRPTVGPGHRLLLRIYLVSVGVLVLLAFTVGLLANFVLGDPWQEFHEPKLQYAADVFASHVHSDDLLREEVRRMRDVGHYAASVYAPDGQLRLSTLSSPVAVLPEDVREGLRDRGVVRLSRLCVPAFCPVAAAMKTDDAIVGYVVFRPDLEVPKGALIPLALVFGGLLVAAVLLARTLTHPLGRLAAAARALGEGDLSARTGLHRSDEIGQVARAFDEMANRLTVVLESQTVLLANVAHELRTPLARIRLALELAADEDIDTARASLSEIATDLDELERLVTDTLVSARMDLLKGRIPSATPPLSMEQVTLSELLKSARSRVPLAEGQLVVECDRSVRPTLTGDPALLRRLLENLLDNARKYSDPGAPITVRCRALPDEVQLEVIDRGVGISPEDLEHIGTPFFRADRSRGRKTGGVGLGLSLSRKIAEAHGGTLSLQSEPGKGTTVVLRLPRARGDVERPRTASSE